MLWGKIVTAEWQEKRKNITSFVIRKEQWNIPRKSILPGHNEDFKCSIRKYLVLYIDTTKFFNNFVIFDHHSALFYLIVSGTVSFKFTLQ